MGRTAVREGDEMVRWFDGIGMWDVPSSRTRHEDGPDFEMYGSFQTRW